MGLTRTTKLHHNQVMPIRLYKTFRLGRWLRLTASPSRLLTGSVGNRRARVAKSVQGPGRASARIPGTKLRIRKG